MMLSAHPRRSWLSLLLLPGLAGLPLLTHAIGPGDHLTDKPYLLFMGADIGVEQGKAVHPVIRVEGDAYVIQVDDRAVRVPMNRGKFSMRVTPELKLSDRTAIVSDFKIERAYTPQRDPVRRWATSQSGMAGQALVGNSAGQMSTAMMGAQQGAIIAQNLSGPGGAGLGGGIAQAAESAAVQSAANDFRQNSAAAGSDLNSAGYATQQLQEELDKQLFDAVRVSGAFSSPRPVRDPYLVIVTQYHDRADPPGEVKHWIFAKALERLDETPLKVTLLQGGFPEGFELLNQQVHVYGSGRELGSNIADRNVWLTRAEAHEYLVIDHLGAHRGETLPAAVALGIDRSALPLQYTDAELQSFVYIKVDPAGLPGGVFRDERATKPVGDDALSAVVAQVRFTPALQAGQPVAGVARVRIADLAP